MAFGTQGPGLRPPGLSFAQSTGAVGGSALRRTPEQKLGDKFAEKVADGKRVGGGTPLVAGGLGSLLLTEREGTLPGMGKRANGRGY